MDEQHGFGLATQHEATVFGARRPGYQKNGLTTEDVDTWISFMRCRDITRVVCLLDEQLRLYDFLPNGLIEHYRGLFGPERVLHAPIEDYRLCDETLLLDSILPFLHSSDEAREKVVVHCSGGTGRTGHVLVAWLVYGRAYEPRQAIEAVKRMCQNPREAICCGNATEEEFMRLLNTCERARGRP